MLGSTYAEPYAGGAGLAMRLLLDDVVERVILNDKCSMLTAFWHTLFEHTDKLLPKISDTSVAFGTWKLTREITQHSAEYSKEEAAFALFFKTGQISQG